MTPLDLTLPLTLGLLSSLHCAQMCGPIVLCLGPKPRTHVAYNVGRIATYSALGAIAGTAGSTLTRLAGIEQTAAIAAGVLMILAGLAMAGAAPKKVLIQIQRARIPRAFTQALARQLRAPGTPRRLLLGVLMGFLPCGLIYAALLKAAATASPAAGAISMLAFGVGTTLSLLAIGLFSTAIRTRLSIRSQTLAAVSVTAMGALILWRGLIATLPGSCHAGM